MPFKDYDQFADDLQLPIRGKVYTIPELGFADGIKLTEHLDPNSKAEPMTNEEFQRLMLGPAYDEMLADNVPGRSVTRATMTALAEFRAGRAAAELFWESNGDPKAATEVLEARQAETTPQDEATTTKRPASGSTTKTSRKS